MRKVTADAVEAFMAGRTGKFSNTTVDVRPWQGGQECVILALHGNPIARYPVAGGHDHMVVCDGNHQTNTTKERLNGLPGVRVHQKAGQWYLNGVAWDGYWTNVGNVMIVKRVGDRQYRVEYPHSSGREPRVFPTHKVARVFAEAEAANHGYNLIAEVKDEVEV